MLSGNKSLKDGVMDLDIPIKDSFLSISYTKTSKLITALYMVTDIIDKGEPIRNKLRHLGAEIISDIHYLPGEACNKIAETVSFLNIASAMNLISEMNCNILKKEFLELNQCIKESTQTKPTWLEEFLKTSSPAKGRTEEGSDPLAFQALPLSKERGNSKGHTRIGVQKGSTLLKALSGVEVSDRTNLLSNSNFTYDGVANSDTLKKQRRDDIISILKNSDGGKNEWMTIKDIKTNIKDRNLTSLISCSEKTLQRELISMVREGVLNKTGEKRWSRYFTKN